MLIMITIINVIIIDTIIIMIIMITSSRISMNVHGHCHDP